MTKRDEGQVRPFADFLREQDKGSTHDEMSVALTELVQRVKDTGKKGTLQLTITVETAKDTNREILVVGDEIKLKLPEFSRKPSVYYADETGNLTRNNPMQPTFESLREVPAGVDPKTGEIREAN